MFNKDTFNAIREFFTSSKRLRLIMLLVSAVFFTVLFSSKYFLFQSIINSDNIARKSVIAQKTIEVVDTFKTNQKRKEVSQRIEPIMKPAEDSYIKNNLHSIFNSVKLIRKKEISSYEKRNEVSTIFDISNTNEKYYLVHHLVSMPDRNFDLLEEKSITTLNNILNTGFSEKDYMRQDLIEIVAQNAPNNVTKAETKMIRGIIEQVIVPNLIIDEKATELAKKNASNSVIPYTITFEKGDNIIFVGELVTPLKRAALKEAGYNVLELNKKGVFGIFILNCLSILILIYYFNFYEKQYFNRNHLSIIALLTTLLGIIAVSIPDNLTLYLIPIPAFVILLSILTNARIAFMCSVILTALLSICLQFPMSVTSVFIFVAMFTSIASAKIDYTRRFYLVKIGFEVALAMAVVISSIYLLKSCMVDFEIANYVQDVIAGFINGLFSGIVVLGMLPLLENWFKIITPYGLAELADHNQPLLKRLQYEAPGTFSHSLMVSNLCEAAAEAVSANPILARVGAFYHDIGKLKRPLFFVENQTYFGIENPHQKLNPKLSKMVITAHPKDGVELAKEYGLPNIIYNFILQHHGAGLASYFYYQAIEEEGAENVKEEQFRYTGPKPNMKETAILMIADAVESAVRAMKTPSSEEIEKIIDKIIVERLNYGQLSYSPITPKDLKIIATTFNRILRGMQHNRIKYHENIVKQLDKNKINLPGKVIDEELNAKINKLENPTQNTSASENNTDQSQDNTNENTNDNNSNENNN